MESLRALNPEASLHLEGGAIAVLLPHSRIATPSGIEEMNTVLCPTGLGGYITRLLLERRIEGKPALNWQSAALLGRTWATWSWNLISPEQPWIQIFAEHARVLR